MTTPLPPESEGWDEDTKKLALELVEIGERWREIEPERADIIRRRAEIYVALDGRDGVSHTAIAGLAGSTKGAVEQVLATQRRKADSRAAD